MIFRFGYFQPTKINKFYFDHTRLWKKLTQYGIEYSRQLSSLVLECTGRHLNNTVGNTKTPELVHKEKEDKTENIATY